MSNDTMSAMTTHGSSDGAGPLLVAGDRLDGCRNPSFAKPFGNLTAVQNHEGNLAGEQHQQSSSRREVLEFLTRTSAFGHVTRGIARRERKGYHEHADNTGPNYLTAVIQQPKLRRLHHVGRGKTS